MRFATLALYSSLIVSAASAHVTTHKHASSSSLTARDVSPSPSSVSIAVQKSSETVDEVDGDFDDDEDEEVDTDDTSLEARARRHHRKTRHRSTKHRNTHKKHHAQQHHNTNFSVTSEDGTFHGKGTFFQPNQGACGKWNTPNDKIVALSADIYQGGSHCFQGVRICHDGKCVDAKVADLCPGCDHTSLDMTSSLFKELAKPEIGVIDIQWSFV